MEWSAQGGGSKSESGSDGSAAGRDLTAHEQGTVDVTGQAVMRRSRRVKGRSAKDAAAARKPGALVQDRGRSWAGAEKSGHMERCSCPR